MISRRKTKTPNPAANKNKEVQLSKDGGDMLKPCFVLIRLKNYNLKFK